MSRTAEQVLAEFTGSGDSQQEAVLDLMYDILPAVDAAECDPLIYLADCCGCVVSAAVAIANALLAEAGKGGYCLTHFVRCSDEGICPFCKLMEVVKESIDTLETLRVIDL